MSSASEEMDTSETTVTPAAAAAGATQTTTQTTSATTSATASDPAAPPSTESDESLSPNVLNTALWKHYELGPQKLGKRGEKIDRKAICKYCQKKISRTQGNTSSMRSHLKARHPAQMADYIRERTKRMRHVDEQQSDLEEAYDEEEAYHGKRLGNEVILNLLLCFDYFQVTQKLLGY